MPTDSPPLAGSIGHIFSFDDGNSSSAPDTGTTTSSQLAQLTAEHRISLPKIRSFPQNLPPLSLDGLSAAESIGRAHDNQDGDAENAPMAGVAVSSSASLLGVSTDSPTGSIGHIFDDADTNASNLNVAGTTASPQNTQPTTERRASSSDILLFHSLSIASFGDFAPADFILHSPDNEHGAAENVPTAEANVSPQNAHILDLPNELLSEIMGLLLSTEPLYAPTHLLLLAPRHVCRHLRKAAERKIPVTLNASHHPFNTGLGGDLELTEWFKGRAKLQYLRQAVSFQIDTRHSLDKDLLKDFVGALLNCQQARVKIDGPAVGTLPTTTSTILPASLIHSFSWISSTLGVRDRIPVDEFPWRILVDDFPWAQLTHLSLDCPLSDLDAFDILSNGPNKFETVSLKLTNMNKNISGNRVVLRRLRSLKIDTHFPVRGLLSKLSLPALENLDLKSHVSPEEGVSPLLNEHLNIPWSQLRSLSLSNEDTRERRCCPVTAILTECGQLQRFQWEGPSRTFRTWTGVLSFVMSQQLEELTVKSDPQGCKLLLEKLLYDGNVIRRVTVSHLDILRGSYTANSLPHWTHITISNGVTLSDISKILNTGRGLTKATFLSIIEGGDSLTGRISSGIQELEICTNIHTPSLWKRLDLSHIQSVKVSFGGVVFNHHQVLYDMAPFLQRYPNLPTPLIYPVRSSSPYDLFR